MIGSLAQQLEVLAPGVGNMCLLEWLGVQRCMCEETQCHAFGLNRCVQSTEMQRRLHLLGCVLSNVRKDFSKT